MTSILTNNSAMNALSTLRNINNNLNTTQDRISTGLKVSSGKDNAAYFSISSTMKGDSGMYKAIDEGLTLTKNSVSTGRLGAETIADLAREFVERLAFAQADGVDRSKVQEELVALTERMDTIVKQSTFNGVSMVDGYIERDSVTAAVADDYTATNPSAPGYVAADDPNKLTIATGVSRTTDGAIDVTKVSLTKVDLGSMVTALKAIDVTDLFLKNAAGEYTDAAGDALTDQTATADYVFDPDAISGLLITAEAELALAVDAATSLGIAEKSIETQQSFLGELSKRLDSGIGSMIDADMESEAARLQALQVQQQLATQALSIANQGPQNILSLFR